MRSYLVLAILFRWLGSATMPAPAHAQMIICSQINVKMPSREQHRKFIATTKRYGPEKAEGFYRVSKPFGDDYLQFQIHYLSEYPGGSGWYDLEGETGLYESNWVNIKSWPCDNDKDYPILVMIGIEPRSIKNGTLYVARREKFATFLSLSRLAKEDRPIPMRLETRSSWCVRMFAQPNSGMTTGNARTCHLFSGAEPRPAPPVLVWCAN